MTDDTPDDDFDGSDTLRVPFVFVKHGDPLPTEWMARHSGWVKFPATLVPRDPAPADTITPGQAYSQSAEAGPAFVPGGMERAVAAGAPISVGRFGRRTRGRPPQYPGGFGAPPGWGGGEDPVAVYLRMSKALWPASTLGVSGVLELSSGPAESRPEGPARTNQNEGANAALHVSDAGMVFIFDEETRGKLRTTRHTYWPGRRSRVTLGAGYDMRFRTPEQIRAELEAIGVDPEKARILSAAGKVKEEGLIGPAAKKFAEDHAKDVTLTVGQQRVLLKRVVPQYEEEVKRLVRAPLNQNEFDALVSFDYARGRGHFQRIADLLNGGDRLQAAHEIEHFDDKLGEDYKPRRKEEAEFMRGDVAKPQPAP